MRLHVPAHGLAVHDALHESVRVLQAAAVLLLAPVLLPQLLLLLLELLLLVVSQYAFEATMVCALANALSCMPACAASARLLFRAVERILACLTGFSELSEVETSQIKTSSITGDYTAQIPITSGAEKRLHRAECYSCAAKWTGASKDL